MEEIRQFLITQCGDPAKNSFEPPTDFDSLVELHSEFEKQNVWYLDKDTMAEDEKDGLYGTELDKIDSLLISSISGKKADVELRHFERNGFIEPSEDE